MAIQRADEISGAVRHMKKSGALWIVIFAFAAGIIMLLISGGLKGEGDGEPVPNDYTYSADSFEAYKQELSKSIISICSRVSGSGEIYVILDFESSGEVIYAQNSNISSDGDERYEYVVIGSGSNAEALYLGHKLPKLSGIGIVCSGGDDARVRDEISLLLASAYGLSLTRICVVPI